ncbi:hook-length control protein FliK [Halomonas daqiaonensis]|uniref:Hook-length control protein FliK n=2 Tax=Halomonas daqiaonensis TaxID=650850 RepID=A0A1H7SSV6_9GAMM|nr:hook-length control protein FliK [Halomonas daqiaonensis]
MVATRLEDSIRHSGLFYESHLARWYKGELPRHQLEREPQMWRTLTLTPSGTSQGAIPSGSLAGARDTPFLPAPPFTQGGRAAAPSQMTNLQATPSTASATASAQAASPAVPQASPDNPSAAITRDPLPEATQRHQASHPVQESLQGIVRHQLEMLVTPALRWEGDVWSGLFMALMIQLPPGHQDRSGAEDADQQQSNAEQQGWRSEIDLDVAGLGRLKASLWMNANSVEIDLRVAHDPSRQELEKGLDSLRSRLAGHGFEEIKVDLNRLDEEQTS